MSGSINVLDQHSEVIANRIYALFQNSYRVEARLLDLEVFPPLQRTRDQIQAADSQFLGILIDEELAAAVEYCWSDSHLSIHSLVVEPLFFRRGLASQLMAELLSTLPWLTAEVETAAANHPAIALYRRFGFRETRTWVTADGIEKVQLALSQGSRTGN
jgi:ribosomal protein S18 acetylase RimI-like enzyme